MGDLGVYAKGPRDPKILESILGASEHIQGNTIYSKDEQVLQYCIGITTFWK